MTVARADAYGATTARKSSRRVRVERAKLGARRSQYAGSPCPPAAADLAWTSRRQRSVQSTSTMRSGAPFMETRGYRIARLVGATIGGTVAGNASEFTDAEAGILGRYFTN